MCLCLASLSFSLPTCIDWRRNNALEHPIWLCTSAVYLQSLWYDEAQQAAHHVLLSSSVWTLMIRWLSAFFRDSLMYKHTRTHTYKEHHHHHHHYHTRVRITARRKGRRDGKGRAVVNRLGLPLASIQFTNQLRFIDRESIPSNILIPSTQRIIRSLCKFHRLIFSLDPIYRQCLPFARLMSSFLLCFCFFSTRKLFIIECERWLVEPSLDYMYVCVYACALSLLSLWRYCTYNAATSISCGTTCQRIGSKECIGSTSSSSRSHRSGNNRNVLTIEEEEKGKKRTDQEEEEEERAS